MLLPTNVKYRVITHQTATNVLSHTKVPQIPSNFINVLLPTKIRVFAHHLSCIYPPSLRIMLFIPNSYIVFSAP